MNNNAPSIVTVGQRVETLRHSDSIDCVVYRKVLLEETMSDLGALKCEDEPEFEYQRIGMGKILITNRFDGELLDDRGDVVISDSPMQEAHIEPLEVGAFAVKKQDLIGAMLGLGILIGFEIIGTFSNAPKWVIAPREEFHNLQRSSP